MYDVDAAFNHPPFMIHALPALLWMAEKTGLGFSFMIRLPAILADAGSLWIVTRLFDQRREEGAIRLGLLLLALSPALILVSGFHGNTDAVVMFFVLLAVWLTERESRGWVAGAAFGAALCVKILPVILLPAFVLYRSSWRRRFEFLVAIATVILTLWAPYVYTNLPGVIHQVFGYKSIYGDWGMAWMVYRLFPHASPSLHDAFAAWGAYVLIGVIAAGAVIVNRRAEKPSLYAQCGASLFLFLAAANGFGVQYLAWLAPWIVGVMFLPVAFFTVASGVFLLLTYNYWSGGMPWFLADANYIGDFSPHLDYFETLCWVSVIILAVVAWKRDELTLPRRPVMAGFCALMLGAIVYPGWRQLRSDARTYPQSVDRAAIATVHAEEQAMLSDAYLKLGRKEDAVVAARLGAALDANSLYVWNSLTRACIRIGRWDEARNAADNALRLAPEDETANAQSYELENHRPGY